MLGTAAELLSKLKKNEIDNISDIKIVFSKEKDIESFLDEVKKKGLSEKLFSLSLFKCDISSKIPNSIFELSNLKSLCVTQCNLLKVEPAIERLTKLENLNLTDNSLAFIPTNISKLCLLKNLILDNNNLIDLPLQYEQLTQLQYVDISSNKFEAIPNCLLGLLAMNNLIISENPIKSIEDKFSVIVARCNIVFDNCFALEEQRFLLLKEKMERLKTASKHQNNSTEAKTSPRAKVLQFSKLGDTKEQVTNMWGNIDMLPPNKTIRTKEICLAATKNWLTL